MAIPLRKLITLILTLFFLTSVFAQTHTPRYISMAPHTNGYYEYLPKNYEANGTKTYPLILFLHGGGEIGSGDSAALRLMLQAGLPGLIHSGRFPASFNVNGQSFSFIVISPQFEYAAKEDLLSSIETIFSYVLQHYKVDPTRLYLTGLSVGGGYTFDYAGKSPAIANKLAAILPIAEASTPDHARARVIAGSNLPVWATHNDRDPEIPASVTEAYIGFINEAPSPNPLAKKTIFSGNVHDAWSKTYDPVFKENGMNVYEWMLQYRRLPVTIAPPPPSAPVSSDSLRFSFFPNPAKNNIKIRLTGPYRGLIHFSVFASNGSLVREESADKQSESWEKTVPTSRLAAANYIVRITAGDFRSTRQFIKTTD